MKITLHPKSLNGTDKFYPGCAQSQLFADLLKQSVLTERDLQVIKQLGYTIEFKHVFTKEQPFL